MSIKLKQLFLFPVLLTALVFLVTLIYNFQIITVESPQEFRENAVLLQTNLLLDGKNPYALSQMPQYTNVYGIFYSLLTLPFAAIFGSSFLVLRLISFMFMIASCYLIFRILIEQKVSWWLSLIPSVLLYAQMMAGGSDFLTKGDSLGLFLFLLSLYLPQKLNFSLLGISLAIFFSLLGFIDKPYFVLGIPYLILYLFIFKSKLKSAVTFGISVLAIFVTFIIVQSLFPTYFLNTIFTNLQTQNKSLELLKNQITQYIGWNFGSLLALIAIFSVKVKSGISVKKIPNISIFNFSLVLSTLLILFEFGPQIGAFMIFFTHLLTPFLFITTFSLISNQKANLKVFLLILISLNLIYWSYQQILANSQILSDNNEQQWSELIGNYSNVYADGLFANILYDQNKLVYDNGQSEYFADSLPLNQKFNLVPQESSLYQAFASNVRHEVKQRKFDIILLARDVSPFDSPYFTKDDLIKNYRPVEFAPFNMYSGSWIVGIWIPINSL